ncbi:MAG TPA: cytochrome b [Caulobacteraceae bacterium]|jgi:cytochrome b561
MTAAVQAAAAPRPARSTYSSVSIALHWLIALLILTNIGLAWYFGTLKGPEAIPPVQLHKSIGITVLLLSLVRIGWRLTHPAPALPEHMAGWEKFAARATHLVFYGLMLGLPLSGWAMVSASPLIKVHPTVLFTVVPWPTFPFLPADHDQLHALRKLFAFTHEKLAWLAYATIVLHVVAALKHHVIDRDDVLSRMLPFLRRKPA